MPRLPDIRKCSSKRCTGVQQAACSECHQLKCDEELLSADVVA